MKTCPCPCGCTAVANSLEEKERIFGWRGKIIQSYCKKCRYVSHSQNPHTENVNPMVDIIFKGINRDYKFTNDYISKLPRYDKNGKLLSHNMKNKLAKQYLLNKNHLFVSHFLKLLDESEPYIEEEKFLKLFEIYNFHTKKPEKESFFNFVISESKEISLKQELNPKKQIFVILKIYQTITETYVKILSEKLKKSPAIIISFVSDIHQDFIENNDQICIFDRDMIQFLLEYRDDRLKLFDVVFNSEKNST